MRRDPYRYRAAPARPRALSSTKVIALLLLHIPLAWAMKQSPLIATVHALATVGLGVSCIVRFRTPERVVYMMGYVIASEALWRSCHARIFHESGKYAVAALAILAILKFDLLRRTDKTALIYFLLLVPSILMLPAFDRRAVSFNLSGPFALAACTMFLSTLRLPLRVYQRLFLTILAPILGFAVVATFLTFTTEDINFYVSRVPSGHLGKNQASSILGLGSLISFLYMIIAPRPRAVRWFVAGVGLWCGAQAALTFSRGGVATGLGAMAIVSFFMLRDRRSRFGVVARVGLIVLLAAYAAIPLLNTVTAGDFERRFTSSHLTGRDKIMAGDLIAFWENPVFGVGPGGSKDYHSRTFGARASPHTEYTRILAEHGSLGLFSLLLLLLMAVKRLRLHTEPLDMAMAAGFTVWAMLFMLHAAMRLSSVSFIFALGASHLVTRSARPAPGQHRVPNQPAQAMPPGRYRSAQAPALRPSPSGRG